MVFVLRLRLHEFIVFIFGLCNAPSIFQHLMKYVYSKTIDQYILVYLDNILVYNKTADDDEKYIHEVFS